MGDGYNVNIEQMRAHAGNVDAIKDRFAAVKSASANIAQDDQAYGLLCGWISGVLEGRHAKQDELIAYVEENLSLLSEALRASGDDYQGLDEEHAGLIRSTGEGMP
ncbi:type VII secretion target [Saccharopolyspora sp. NPDC050389]|uniref:type VII secretion target n=1 Tax=Saccharopolyspora sp. NPDC050389 TaxID=3155516 RepID=UPI0033E0680B